MGLSFLFFRVVFIQPDILKRPENDNDILKFGETRGGSPPPTTKKKEAPHLRGSSAGGALCHAWRER